MNRRLGQLQQGFTIVELLVVITLVGILGTAAYPFLSNSFSQYFTLQEDGIKYGDLAIQSQRMAYVLRGATDITAATETELSLYAYFYPNSTYVSLIRYYRSPDNTKLLADVTPMTSNPPVGTPITASMQTFTVINNFYAVPSLDTFVYLDTTGNALTMPLDDLHTIKTIRVNLATPQPNSGNQVKYNSMTLEVSLRNRKTNL